MNSSTRLSAETTGASSITNRKQTLEALRTKVEDKIANLGSGQFNLTDCVKLHEDIEELKNSDTLSPDQLAEISFKVFPYFLKLRHYVKTLCWN